ncbi:MAG: alpha/beta hydrolase [Gammaproteobacteria bacterium]|nr:alpha/beta hydrolase [Gammaproteobacteria bacterium]
MKNLSRIEYFISLHFIYILATISIQQTYAQTPDETRFAEVNGTRIYYEIAGQGQPLLLIHGGAVDNRAFDEQFYVFAEHYQTIRFDLRGAGRSGDRDSPFNNAEDVYQLLKFLNIENAYLLGISRGGGFAFDVTLEHPEMVDALILVSANMGVNVPAYHEMFDRATEAGKDKGARAAAEVWGYDPYQGPRRESAREKVLGIIEENMPRFRYFDGHEPVEQFRYSDQPRWERLHEIQVPSLVLSGAYDNEVARRNSRNWAEGIPNARLVLFEESGHLVNIDEVDKFNQTVLDFLENLQ